ncbi:MAG: HEPN domain-containing protein [Candidatus Tectomicrobia bacterium]|uniref:HEPN domain-containing protein n=1 Tax=Tectimicrobiota bacterium TaxID=2528274 RepID=A0A932GQJ4_UNCTE|nr:HEPN domain-containing protein [Candidatus Tectomicrobia bacterium]
MPPKTDPTGQPKEWLRRAKGEGHSIPQEIWEAVDLTDYAVETRYPGPAEPVTQKEYRAAVRIAEQVVKWAGRIISGKQR